MDLLVAAAREQGTTVVLVTHEARVAAYADREVIVRDGRVSTLDRSRAVVIRLRAAAHPGRRPGGRHPAGRHRRRGRARRRAAADPLAGVNAVNAQNARYAWLSTGTAVDRRRRRRRGRPAVVALRGDYFDGQIIGRVDVAATGPTRRSRPGIPRLPGPGEYYASPALAALLRSDPGRPARRPLPRARWSARSATPRCRRPDSLLIVVGHTAGRAGRTPGAEQVDRDRDHVAERLQRPVPARRRASTPTASTWSCPWWRPRCCSRC